VPHAPLISFTVLSPDTGYAFQNHCTTTETLILRIRPYLADHFRINCASISFNLRLLTFHERTRPFEMSLLLHHLFHFTHDHTLPAVGTATVGHTTCRQQFSLYTMETEETKICHRKYGQPTFIP
jgi:hypothetical protein